MSSDEATAGSRSDDPPTWRELAVARSLDPARARAENRVQRYLDAAFELMNGDSGGDFTVQEVVERSGQSLRGFYQYFAGKHELLLAVFEESIRTTAEHLGEVVAEEHEPLARVHRFAVEYYRMCRPVAKAKGANKKKRATPAMAEFAQQLLTSHPQEASRAFTPLVSLFVELLDDAAAAGAIRSDLHHGRLAGVVLQAIMFNAFSGIISGEVTRDEDEAEKLFDILLVGIGTGAR
jgi:AcrR family transcriptional regulator